MVSELSRSCGALEHSISVFLNNLKPKLSDAVSVEKSCSLPQAYYFARLKESKFAAQSKEIRGTISGLWQRNPNYDMEGVYLVDAGSHFPRCNNNNKPSVFPLSGVWGGGKNDVVLGVKWLCPLDDINFNFKKLIMEFEYKANLLTLQVSSEESSIEDDGAGKRMIQRGNKAVAQVLVIYDATGVRLHAGRQAEVLNQIVCELPAEHPLADSIPLRELLGHTPPQVVAGGFLGMVTAMIVWLITCSGYGA
ncbi:putative ATP-dependent DNA helicase Q-like 5-like [Capsicum annuum]|nr:putative ATP-dependent DNA helicase Q-like 5-like [Capsicum annuum]